MVDGRFMVTGGSGFIGTHLVDALVSSGLDVMNLDTRPPILTSHRGHWQSLDLRDSQALTACVSEFRPKAIINLAAIADLSLSFEQMAVNVTGVENLLSAALAATPHPRIVHVSTQLVVRPGHVPSGPRDYAPYSEYGKSKAASEEVLWSKGEGLNWVIARPTNVWGPWHPTFADSTWKYLARRWYMIPTGKAAIRGYGYVKNVASQLIAAATIDGEMVDRKVLYVGDEAISSDLWLDGFSMALAGKPVRRIPRALLALLAHGGEAIKGVGGSVPFDLGRLHRISTDYPVPMSPTFALLGRGPLSLDQGIRETVDWLNGRVAISE